MTFGIVLLIVLTVALAWTVLASDKASEQERQRLADYEAQRDRYIAWVRAKYARPQRHQYKDRSHIDYAGEEPLSPMELEAVKREVCR